MSRYVPAGTDGRDMSRYVPAGTDGKGDGGLYC
jgi:hypothetical protein